MAITVKFFAGLRERLGRSETEVDGATVATAADVWRAAAGESMPPNTLVAINQDYAKPGDSVGDGDEVAFFPPVTGG